jgi:hypothetical protein
MSHRALRFAVVAGWGLLAGTGMFGGASLALAAGGSVTLRVTPLLDTAYYSTPSGTTYSVGWSVTVTNNSATEPSRPVLFLGRTVVHDPKEKARFDNYYFSGADPKCRSATLFPSAVGCVIPGLLPGQSLTFAVSYKTPAKVLGGPGDVEGTDYVNFRGTTLVGENHDLFVDRDARNRVTLLSANPLSVATVCPPDGCTAFTGTNGGIPTATDVHTTQVDVPAGDTFTTIRIEETKTGGSPTEPCTVNVIECWMSQLTIPGNFSPAPAPTLQLAASTTAPTFDPYLTVFLRQDISNIAFQQCGGEISLLSASAYSCDGSQRVPIGNIKIVYVPDGPGEAFNLDTCGEVGPTVGVPCIFRRTVVRGDGGDGDVLYYEWELRAKHNGGYKVE